MVSFQHIKAFAFDVDGVLTDGQLLITESGELLRSMNVRDGQAIKIAMENGYTVAIFTKGSSAGVRKRFEVLGVQHVFDALSSKPEAFEKYAQSHGIDPHTVLYMGDDLPDVPMKAKVGIFSCPYDAVPEVQAIADYISPLGGGKGCVRDVIEKVMRTQYQWPSY